MQHTHLKPLLQKTKNLQAEIRKSIFGQEEAVRQMLVALFAGGHALLQGVPGLAKTLMIRTLAKCLQLQFKRVQFTPDLMPSDILGTEVLETDQSGKRTFRFIKGPIFTNLLLADEINRTPPKTQAALLEAMQESRVTYAGIDYPLEPPYFIMATQNPIEQAGTYALPEAQLDRFLLQINIDYPSEETELQILNETTGTASQQPEAVMTGKEVLALQHFVRQVAVSPDLVNYVNRLVRAGRPQTGALSNIKEWVQWGAGPRAGQALLLTAKAHALLNGSYAVTPPDLEKMAFPVLRHRLIPSLQAEAEGITTKQIIQHLLDEIQPPSGKWK